MRRVVLVDAPEEEPGSPNRFLPQPNNFEQGASTSGTPTGQPIPAGRKSKFRKLSAEEPRARKHREPRRHDPERGKKIFYMIGGVFLMLLGGAIGFFSINEGISIRGGVFGFFMVIGGISTFFQGVSGATSSTTSDYRTAYNSISERGVSPVSFWWFGVSRFSRSHHADVRSSLLVVCGGPENTGWLHAGSAGFCHGDAVTMPAIRWRCLNICK